MLKGDDMSHRFFRVVTELTVDKYQSDSNLQAVDAFAKLVVLLVKYADGAQSMTRVNLVSKVLSVVTRSLVREYESNKFKFDQRPFYRLFVQWLEGFNAAEFEAINFQVLTVFSNTFHSLQPCQDLALHGWSSSPIVCSCRSYCWPRTRRDGSSSSGF